MSRLIVGLDVGQANDYTAMTVVEDRGNDHDSGRWAVRALGRAPLGLPYPVVCDRVGGAVAQLAADNSVWLAVDATGVGQPVVELLRSKVAGIPVHAITITGGDRASSEGLIHRVPKRDLVAGAQVLLQQRQLKWPTGLTLIETLAEELLGMQVILSPAGFARYEHPPGEHDDLVLSLCCALWLADKRLSRYGARHGGALIRRMIQDAESRELLSRYPR